MAKASRDRAEVNARVVYWGIEGSGKRANLNTAFAKLRPDHRGELREEPTRLDPSVSYQVLPIELGDIAGVRTRIEMIAAPGGPEQAPTRKQLLDQVDGVVLVIDSQGSMFDPNLESIEELRATLETYGRSLAEIPLVVQYNKRDLADAYALEELYRRLDLHGAAVFEAVATEGTGVLETLSTISKRVIRSLRDQAGGPEASARPATAEGAPTLHPEPSQHAAATEEAGVPYSEATSVPEAGARAAEAEPAQLPHERGSGSPPADDEDLESKPLEEFEVASPIERMENAILEEEEHPESREIAEAAYRTETLLDTPLPGLDDEAEEAVGIRLGPDVSIVSVGEAVRAGDRSVRVPLVLGDAAGRSTTLLLTIQLDPLIDQDPI